MSTGAGPTERESFSVPGKQTCIMDELTERIREHVRAALQGSGAHGFDHTERVVRLCELLGASEGADMAVLIPAALFHDIARPLEEETGVPHEEEGARMAESFLRSIQYPGDRIPGIVHAIRAHRYSSGIAPDTQEARVLSDADKLDAMGAVGIARTFMQAGATGRRCDGRHVRSLRSRQASSAGAREARRSSSGIPDATDHIREKLLNLRSLMYTQSARTIAERRHAFLATFIETLDDEVHARPSSSPEAGSDHL
ncbi:hypothetical protein ES707_16518 [subsurface metagenome]